MYLTTRGLGASGSQYLQSAGGTILSAAPFTGPAAPFVAVAGLVTEFLGQMGIVSGCGQTCVLSSQYANQAEALLRQNLATYQALPSPRTQSQQSAGLQIFDTIWNDLKQQCSNPSLGTAGQNCIGDRQAGACKWKNNGVCWNWFVGYRDPIANDSVVPDSVLSAASTAAGTVASDLGFSSSSNLVPLLGIAALLGLAVIS